MPQSNADWDASEPNAYSNSYSYAYADIYAYGDGNSYAHADIYTDCDGNSDAYANGDCDGNGNVYSNRNGYRHRYSNCVGIAAAYTDAKASADTAGACIRQLLFRKF